MDYQNSKASDRYKPRHALRPPYAANRKEPRKEPCGGHLLRQAPVDKRGHHPYAHQEQCNIALNGWIPVLHCGSRISPNGVLADMGLIAAGHILHPRQYGGNRGVKFAFELLSITEVLVSRIPAKPCNSLNAEKATPTASY